MHKTGRRAQSSPACAFLVGNHPTTYIEQPSNDWMSGLLDWMLVAGCWIFFTETRFALWKNPDFEKRSKNLEAIRLPLRHEMGGEGRG
jgi:hypothetical protein